MRNIACDTIKFGTYAAYGVADIRIIGNAEQGKKGAIIYCQGVGSCLNTVIVADYVQTVSCHGTSACDGAVISINEPKSGFLLECSGIDSCNGLTIEIVMASNKASDCIGVLPMQGIRCFDARSCEGMAIKLVNTGCNAVSIESVQCHRHTSCKQAHFQFIGDIDIEQCKCGVGTSCNNALGLDQCFKTLYKMACGDPSPPVDVCKGQSRTILNPASGFIFECKNERSCQDSDFTIELTHNVEYLGPMKLQGFQSAMDATFTIRNLQQKHIELEYIECSGIESCKGATFISGELVTFKGVICAKNACNECLIKQSAADPGIPCQRFV